MKRIQILLMTAMLALLLLPACGDLYDPQPVSQSPADESVLAIGCFNVEDFESGDYTGIADFIQNYKLDVVMIQEMQPGSRWDHTYSDGSPGSKGDTVKFNEALVFKNYNMPYYVYSIDGGGRNDYICAWSRYPISDLASVKPSQMRDPNTGHWYGGYRPVLRFSIMFNGKKIWFYGMHLKSNSGGSPSNIEMRRAQANHLSKYIRINHDPVNDYIVLAGDMNTLTNDYDNSGASTIDYLCLKNDDPGNTANNLYPVNLNILGGETNFNTDISNMGNPGVIGAVNAGVTYYDEGAFASTLDHIIVSKRLWDKVDTCTISPGGLFDGWRGASDHYPLLITITNL